MSECLTCDGEGYVCGYCGLPVPDCDCEDGPDQVECPDCGGDGMEDE